MDFRHEIDGCHSSGDAAEKTARGLEDTTSP